MNLLPLGRTSVSGDVKSRFAFNLVKQVMARPEAQIDRESFLRKELRSHCSEEQVECAIQFNPAKAHIPISKIDRIADSVIRTQVLYAGMGSFATGVPGGFALLATIPADSIQFFWHALKLAQKLAYLYGMSDMLQNGEVDDETEGHIIVLLGVMLGVGQANNALNLIAKRFQQQVRTRVPRQALTKTFYYPAIKKTARWIGIKLTKDTFAKGASKIVPDFGGLVAAGLTTFTLPRMARRLKKHLRKLEYAQPSRDTQLLGAKT